jgi:glycosyltransferase involved in cell wall biosynthesis
MKIVHLTSAHDRYDIRIFIKMCCSLAKHEGWDVSLVVADGLGYEERNGVKIYDVGKSQSRFLRIFTTSRLVVNKARELNADIYHFHDPEILLWLKLLKNRGAKVIYDVHEDLPRQLLSKPYLNPFLLRILAKTVEVFENWSAKKCNLILTVTPFIRDRFSAFHNKVAISANFPLFNEFETNKTEKENYMCYVGGLTRNRGLLQMLKIAGKLKLTLKLAGSVDDDELLNIIGTAPYVEYLGLLDREELAALISKAKIGLCILHPIPNYVVAYPIKIFEYMAARTPVIASNFPLYVDIVEGNNSGICVDPLNTEEIAKAVTKIMTDQILSIEMGENGFQAVLKKYNWGSEEKKLYELYSDFI